MHCSLFLAALSLYTPGLMSYEGNTEYLLMHDHDKLITKLIGEFFYSCTFWFLLTPLKST